MSLGVAQLHLLWCSSLSGHIFVPDELLGVLITFRETSNCNTHNNCIFTNINIRPYWYRTDNSIFANKHMITYMQWKEGNSANMFKFSEPCETLRWGHILTYALLNCLKGGRTTAPLLITQYLPVLTLARSPRIIAPLCTITLPWRIIFCDPQSIVCLLTLLPDA